MTTRRSLDDVLRSTSDVLFPDQGGRHPVGIGSRGLEGDTPLHVIMRPADTFVAELVGADDILRRLSLVSVEAAMLPLPAGEMIGADEPVIDLPLRVRPALNLLLESGQPRLIVRRDGVPVGSLDLEAIQAVSVPRVGSTAP